MAEKAPAVLELAHAPPDAPGLPTATTRDPEVANVESSKVVYLKSWKPAFVTFSLCLGTFLVALDINIIGVAVPKITSVFDSLSDASWYASAYLLAVTALQPTMGFLYKSFNVRFIYFSSVIIFEGM